MKSETLPVDLHSEGHTSLPPQIPQEGSPAVGPDQLYPHVADRLKHLKDFVDEECKKRLAAYKAQPRDAAEHFETENDVLSGARADRLTNCAAEGGSAAHRIPRRARR